VLNEARRMADAGYTDIQLLGQNVNSYRDPAGKQTFAELLAAVGGVSGIRRVRFTTSHPKDFTKDIVEAIDAVPSLCDHVHLPVQSGSSRVLKSMFREYSREQYLERIAWMKGTRNREISITTDVIVGFPGETEAEFNETLGLLDEVGYDGVFSFKYSPRPNTLAALRMPDDVSDVEKTSRIVALQALQRDIQTRLHEDAVGSIQRVLVDSASRRQPDEISGRSSGNTVVNLPVPADRGEHRSSPAWIGHTIDVRITRAGPYSLWGEAV
jgi:tRNA-2-methylthio-N6-dimethylallyladenosine synthase